MNNDKIINALKKLEFTEYEAKVYMALLSSQPANGNEIAIASGVPAPKVYETLRKLNERKIVTPISTAVNGRKIQYVPISCGDFLNREKNEFSNNIEILESGLKEIASFNETSLINLFMIKGYSASLEAIKYSINDSKFEILISGWCNDIEELREELNAAFERKVTIITLLFDKNEVYVPWKNYIHYNDCSMKKRHKGEFCAVIDRENSIMLQTSNDGEGPHAVISGHPSVVNAIHNYIRHDIILNQMAHDLEKSNIERLDLNYDPIYDKSNE